MYSGDGETLGKNQLFLVNCPFKLPTTSTPTDTTHNNVRTTEEMFVLGIPMGIGHGWVQGRHSSPWISHRTTPKKTMVHLLFTFNFFTCFLCDLENIKLLIY